MESPLAGTLQRGGRDAQAALTALLAFLLMALVGSRRRDGYKMYRNRMFPFSCPFWYSASVGTKPFPWGCCQCSVTETIANSSWMSPSGSVPLYIWDKQNAPPLRSTLCSLVIFLPYGSSSFPREMVVCNISSNIKSLNVHLPGLHHGFICGQLQQPEPLFKINQTKPGPLLAANQTLWNIDTGFRQFFSAYLIILFIHFDNIV